MPIMKASSFIAWELSEDEVLSGSLLNEDQIKLIQTQLTQVAEQLIALTVKTENVMEFIQEQAYLTGQKELYQQMLEASKQAWKIAQERAQSNRQ